MVLDEADWSTDKYAGGQKFASVAGKQVWQG